MVICDLQIGNEIHLMNIYYFGWLSDCSKKLLRNVFFVVVSELLRDYITRFNEATIRVLPPNQKRFVGVFYNALDVGHFNESLTQKPTLSLAELVTRV